jgi:hypothetical protein
VLLVPLPVLLLLWLELQVEKAVTSPCLCCSAGSASAVTRSPAMPMLLPVLMVERMLAWQLAGLVQVLELVVLLLAALVPVLELLVLLPVLLLLLLELQVEKAVTSPCLCCSAGSASAVTRPPAMPMLLPVLMVERMLAWQLAGLVQVLALVVLLLAALVPVLELLVLLARLLAALVPVWERLVLLALLLSVLMPVLLLLLALLLAELPAVLRPVAFGLVLCCPWAA